MLEKLAMICSHRMESLKVGGLVGEVGSQGGWGCGGGEVPGWVGDGEVGFQGAWAGGGGVPYPV